MKSVGSRAVAGSYDGTKGVFAEGYVPTLYAWKYSTAIVYTKTATPSTSDMAFIGASTGLSEEAITAVGTGTITADSITYERYSDGDIAVD